MLTTTHHSPCVIGPKLSNTHYSLSCCLSPDNTGEGRRRGRAVGMQRGHTLVCLSSIACPLSLLSHAYISVRMGGKKTGLLTPLCTLTNACPFTPRWPLAVSPLPAPLAHCTPPPGAGPLCASPWPLPSAHWQH